ncbi:MAG: tyrosine--tRNA ligase [Planctomycetota bacterium]|nr:MAG: tyrosine--tRNA ligase [Planctomycetota bacterium]
MSDLQRLLRLASDVVTPEELARRLDEAGRAGRRLRVKFGIDPTFTQVHVGHAVPIRVLRLFQELGHLPVLIIGDATARLGDPTGRNEQRPPLSAEEVEHNAATYLDQIGRILDLSAGACEVRRNSEWFGAMDFFDGLRLAAHATVARLLERDDFQQRQDRRLPIHLHELMYPLMQGWDSVMVRADVELGGNDQLFNLHMGRQLQEREGQPPQVCFTTPLLLGTDGRKMSKTYGNHLPLTAPPDEAFGKVMSLADDAMADWFRLLTPLEPEEVEAVLAGHPRAAKARLAREIVAWLHDAEAAAAAEAEFDRRFRDRQLPSEVPELSLPGGERPLPALLKEAGLTASTSEARRLIAQGGVRIDGRAAADPNETVVLGAEAVLVQVGKRRVARLRGS